MQDNGIEALSSTTTSIKNSVPVIPPNPFHAESLHYNGRTITFCPMGQHMNRIELDVTKTASGYITESARYKAQRCEGCPLWQLL